MPHRWNRFKGTCTQYPYTSPLNCAITETHRDKTTIYTTRPSPAQWQNKKCKIACIGYHLLNNLPTAQTVPPPPTGNTRIQTPRSQTNLRYNLRLCKVCSFRCNSSSPSVSLGRPGPSSEGVCGGMMIDNGFLKLWMMT